LATDVIRSAVDSTLGKLNLGVRTALELFDPQNRNLFEILLYPKAVESNPTDLMSIGSAIMDSTITKLYIQSMDIPFMGFKYADYNELKGVQDIEFPTGCTFTFIENEAGVVRNYLNHWMKEIAFPVYEKDSTSGILRTNYVFTDNQEGAKKNAIIMPLTGMNLPSTGWIKIEGLKLEKIENITFDQGEAEPMKIVVSLSVDSIWFKCLFS
jgi:hypothetical protein